MKCVWSQAVLCLFVHGFCLTFTCFLGLRFVVVAFDLGRKNTTCASRARYLRAAQADDGVDWLSGWGMHLSEWLWLGGGVTGFLRVLLRVRGDC